ncbi:tripartite motif-containing protein 2-like [Branchiostoma floridae x Branchiostoma belcheri]
MGTGASGMKREVHEELSCSICLELFTRPKVLPCQHTFCQDCLQDLAGRGGTLKCPNCRQQVTLPPQGVAGLPDNLMAANMCEKVRKQETLLEETEKQPQSGNRCSFHPSEEVKLYCKQCNLPVCTECCEESHDGHPTTGLKKAAQERRSTVQALINEGKNILESYGGFITDLGEKEKSLNEQKQKRDNSIIQAYNKMVQKLTERKDDLLSESHQNHSKNLDRIQTERDRVSADVNELSAACDRAEQELQQGGVEILSQQTALTEVVTFGGWGPGTRQFMYPEGVTVSDEGDIFVADYWNHRIQVFTLQGTFVRQFPTVVSGEQKMRPDDVAMDGEGNLWVVGDTGPAEFAVQYNKQGRVLRKFDLQEAEWDRGVAVDTRRNHILITKTTGDWHNLHGEVLVFRPDGTLVRTVGQQQGMKEPRYITVDREGNILVSDEDNPCVFVYNEDGQFLFQFGGRGSDEGQLSHPRGICTDRAGNIIVADNGNKRVEMFDKTGKFLKHIATDMERPQAVAMATQGQLVVTNEGNNTVTIFHNC